MTENKDTQCINRLVFNVIISNVTEGIIQ